MLGKVKGLFPNKIRFLKREKPRIIFDRNEKKKKGK